MTNPSTQEPSSAAVPVAAAAAATKEIQRRFRLPKIKAIVMKNGAPQTVFPFLEDASNIDYELLELLKEHRPYAKANKAQRAAGEGKGTMWKAFHDACKEHVDWDGKKCLDGLGLQTIKDRMISYKKVIAELEDPNRVVENDPVLSDDAKKLRRLLKAVVMDMIQSEAKREPREHVFIYHDGPVPADVAHNRSRNQVCLVDDELIGPYAHCRTEVVSMPSAAAAASAAVRAVLVPTSVNTVAHNRRGHDNLHDDEFDEESAVGPATAKRRRNTEMDEVGPPSSRRVSTSNDSNDEEGF